MITLGMRGQLTHMLKNSGTNWGIKAHILRQYGEWDISLRSEVQAGL